jgi:hypothetical protein
VAFCRYGGGVVQWPTYLDDPDERRADRTFSLLSSLTALISGIILLLTVLFGHWDATGAAP